MMSDSWLCWNCYGKKHPVSTLADYRHPGPIRDLLDTLAVVVCPPQAIELGLQSAIVEHVELSMRASPASVRVALLAGLSGYELASMAWPGHWGKRASRLSPKSAASYFAAWYHSPLMPQHEFAKGIKSLLCLACYEQPAMMEAIGYTPGAWIDQSIKYRLKTYSAAIAQREREILAPDPLPKVQPKPRRAES